MIHWEFLILLVTLDRLIKTLSYLELIKVCFILWRDRATQRLL